MTGCSGGNGQDDAFWAEIGTPEGADEAEHFDTASAMVQASDFVAAGRFVGTQGVRKIQGDAAEDVVFFAQLEFEIDGVVHGRADERSITIEFLIASGSQSEADEVMSALAESTPDSGMLLFSREKRGEGESGLFRPVNSLGLWTESEGSPVAPLSDDDSKAGELLRSANSPDDLADLRSWIESQPAS